MDAPNGYAAPGVHFPFLAPVAIGTKEVNSNVFANQIADRQWWEIQVSPVNRNHMWLENGMALYSEALWTEKEKGATAIDQRMKDVSDHRIDRRQRTADPDGAHGRLFAGVLGSQRR